MFDETPLVEILARHELYDLADDPRFIDLLESAHDRAELLEGEDVSLEFYDQINLDIFNFLTTQLSYQSVSETIHLNLNGQVYRLPSQSDIPPYVRYEQFIETTIANIEFFEQLCGKLMEDNYDFETYHVGVLLLAGAYLMGRNREFVPYIEGKLANEPQIAIEFAKLQFDSYFQEGLKKKVSPAKFKEYCLKRIDESRSDWESGLITDDAFTNSFAIYGLNLIARKFDMIEALHGLGYKETYQVQNRVN